MSMAIIEFDMHSPTLGFRRLHQMSGKGTGRLPMLHRSMMEHFGPRLGCTIALSES